MTATRRQVLQSGGAMVVYFALPGCGADEATAPQAVTAIGGHAALGNRIKIDSAGTVNLMLGKVELGQGIGTALAQMAAEELGVDFGRVELSTVDTNYSPDESYTFSSISIQQSGPPVRRAAAAGRRILLQKAARELGVDVSALGVDDGEVLNAGVAAGVDYWQLLQGGNLEVVPSQEEALMSASVYKVVGKSKQRLDIPDKVFGNASFLHDLRLPGMVHARVIRPPAERAELADFDPAATTGMPGVLKVVNDGNFVAVIAERETQARNAAAALRRSLNWSLAADMPASGSIYDWLKTANTRIETVASRRSDAVSISDTTSLKAIYQRPYQAHASISPSAAIAEFENGDLTVWSHAQGMYPLRTAISHILGLEPERVRCVHYEAAGCFGHNGADDAACDAAALATQLPGRPVRLQWERADEFAWEPYGSAMHIETRAELNDSGRVQSWDLDIWSCPHTSRPRNAGSAAHLIYAQHRSESVPVPEAASIPQPAGGVDRNGIPMYAFENLNVTKHLVTDVPLRVSALRGLGAYGNVFAIESFMDELAVATEQDPLAFRLRHLEDQRAVELLERLSEVSNWSERPAHGSGEGWGIGFARFKNLSSYVGVVFKLGVDTNTGDIALQRAIAVCDSGLVINPDGVRAQVEGGIVQSASWTLKEQIRFSESEKQSIDWASYPILRFDEVPEVEVHLMSRDDQKSLGVGEAAQGPAAAAIANAVFHASGRRLRRLPLTADQFLGSDTF